MSSNTTRESMWQRTMRAFLGDRVRVKLHGGTFLEGELVDPQPYTVQLKQLSGAMRLVDYDQIASVEAAKEEGA